jgi:hypothetical protein
MNPTNLVSGEGGETLSPAGPNIHRAEQPLRRMVPPANSVDMDTNTILIILVVLLVIGGGGFYGRGRWY